MSVPVSQLEKALSYPFADPSLALRALTHSSAGSDNNERLEFLGDAVLGFVVAAELFRRHPEAPEGELSRMRAALVNQQSLADIATRLQLGDLLTLGPGERKAGGRSRASILSDALEAVFGAICLDGGLEAARKVILAAYGEALASGARVERAKDPKTRLQELLQAKGKSLPVYEVLNIEGEDHQQTFHVSCQVPLLRHCTEGRGRNRKLAEQEAAEKALKALEQQL
ncbi:MAG: ribonuclease III [Pseudomonadales bacterium]|nr:ribonuclease III [Pseudomonadales bacterium]MCP5358107.1 ribonuclease III [Pseudomonadales bacterium]